MFAVVKTGGKQYRVEPGVIIEIEKLNGDIGSEVTLSDVLLYADGDDIRIGQPLLDNVGVTAEIIDHKKDTKKTIFKKIRRHGKQLKKGHRQPLTVLKVKDISSGSAKS